MQGVIWDVSLLRPVSATAGPLRSGQKILINGAGGSVGTIAIQLAKCQDVEVTGVDSALKFAMMQAIGFDHVIDYTKENFASSGRRYDLIRDTKTTRSPFTTLSLSPGEHTPQSVETCPACSSHSVHGSHLPELRL